MKQINKIQSGVNEVIGKVGNCWDSNPYLSLQNIVVLATVYAMETSGIFDKCQAKKQNYTA